MKELKLLPYEIWRTVKTDKRYEVSNMGQIKSLSRIDSNSRRRQEQILKPRKNTNGYLQVSLYPNGKEKLFLVHRLVAEAFIPNPQNLPCVNHKDENPLNCRVENLEWCTQEYNLNYGTRNERVSKAMTNGKLSKAVYQKTLDGEFVKEYPSTQEVQRQTGWSQQSISACCLGKIKSAYGYIWKYKQSI